MQFTQIPGRSVLSAALARDRFANPPRRSGLPIARGTGAAIERALMLQGRGAGDIPEGDSYGTGTGTKQTGITALPTLPSPNSSVYNSAQVSVNTPSGANLRSQPNATSQILAGEVSGTVLYVVGTQQDGWINVQDPNGLTGWIYSAYVTDASGAQNITSTPSATPSILGGASDAGGVGAAASASGLTGVLVIGAIAFGAYWFLVK